MELKNSTVLITGGTSGIGLEFVEQLSKARANIIVTGHNLEPLHVTRKRYPAVHIFQSNLSKPQNIETLSEQVPRQFPGLNMTFVQKLS